jgi:hypothetical protein
MYPTNIVSLENKGSRTTSFSGAFASTGPERWTMALFAKLCSFDYDRAGLLNAFTVDEMFEDCVCHGQQDKHR